MVFFARKLVNKIYLTKDTVQLDFEKGDFDFKAGQFITVSVPGDGVPIARSYSIASSPHETDFFSLCVKVVPNGKGSNYLTSLEPGEQVKFEGPFGTFIIDSNNSKKDLVFVATGVGIAPFMSMILDLSQRGDERKISLYFGVRHSEDLFYKDILEKLAQENSNLKLFISLSQPEANWSGLKGRVTEHFDDLDMANSDFYICGNGDAVKNIYTLLKQKGAVRECLHVEQFTPIG
ncbi:MAG: FAD-dependent oxidoreductase [Candidatus Gracilibacteria bacterium]